MALWSNVDEANSAPQHIVDVTDGETGVESYGKTPVGTFGVDTDETTSGAGITHGGWILRTEGSGGRSGRVFNETLVAMGSMTGDGDSLPPLPVITIDTQPANDSVTTGDPAEYTVVASISDSDATLSYQWQVSTDSGSSWASTSDADGTTDTLTVISTDAEYVTGNQFRVVVSGTNGAVSVTSNAATLTIT